MLLPADPGATYAATHGRVYDLLAIVRRCFIIFCIARDIISLHFALQPMGSTVLSVLPIVDVLLLLFPIGVDAPLLCCGCWGSTLRAPATPGVPPLVGISLLVAILFLVATLPRVLLSVGFSLPWVPMLVVFALKSVQSWLLFVALGAPPCLVPRLVDFFPR